MITWDLIPDNKGLDLAHLVDVLLIFPKKSEILNYDDLSLRVLGDELAGFRARRLIHANRDKIRADSAEISNGPLGGIESDDVDCRSWLNSHGDTSFAE